MHLGFLRQVKLLAFKVNFYLDEVLSCLGFRTDLAPVSAVVGKETFRIWKNQPYKTIMTLWKGAARFPNESRHIWKICGLN